LCGRDLTETVLKAIVAESGLNKPGIGTTFVLEVGKVVGINH
jgi:hypothetical protein